MWYTLSGRSVFFTKSQSVLEIYNSREFAEALNKAGGKASVFELPSFEGHIGGLTDIMKAGTTIKSFLDE